MEMPESPSIRRLTENLLPIATLMLVLVSAMAAGLYLDVINLEDQEPNTSVNVTDTTCIELENRTVCYDEENRSEINLTDQSNTSDDVNISAFR